MYNNVRWLSRGKVLERFVECFEEIKVFLDDKDLGNFPQLNDDKWVNNLMLFTDLSVHINELNLKLQARGQHWLTHAWLPQPRAICENPRVQLEAVRTLNPSTFLPVAEGAPEHDGLGFLEEVYSSRPDLTDKPLKKLDLVLFTDGSSFLDKAKKTSQTIEAQALPEGWSAQRAERWALVRALELSKDTRANIYTDSRYAFATLHLLEAVWEPKEIAVIHCKGTAVHPYKPGDQVWVKDWKKEPLMPTWKGPYPVILTTPTALKVAGLNTWIHHSRVKAAHQPSDTQPEWKVTSDQKHPLQITLKRTADLVDQPAPRNPEMPC
ncbi:hypothetical protein QTO34_004249 [Cnephaeus nilssonii]|uniref:RNase H type-1 domain-containing protein n=1 Tax=Cnephaeus nilssonii TaxID=3371016 RepID=A0AA40HSE9_CNENI|nr:hypothetical protein QTO34_004249 [Eptesicus nilssonii]